MTTDVDVYPLFSTPLYKTNLKRSDDDILTFTGTQNFKFLEQVKNGYVSENVYVLETPELKQLKSEIQNNVDFFVYDVLGVDNSIKFNMTNSWIMKHKTGHWAQEHFHTHSLITGIYYFDVRSDSGNITFTKNKMFVNIFSPFFSIPFGKKTNFSEDKITITPKNGDLLLFPSHLLHHVSTNLSENERHCLTFNMFIRGTLGSDEWFDRLDFK
jgi:uncharacterized protein (TIGR02466 family)